jgi:hypothetical protein
MLEAAEPFPATRSAVQGFAVDACLFTGPKSSTVYQAGEHSVSYTQIPRAVLVQLCVGPVMSNPPCACPIRNASRLASQAR